jgi:hypothetical protein
MFERMEQVILRFTENVEPADKETIVARKETAELLQSVAKNVSGNEAKRIVHAARHAVQKEGTGAQVLLDLALRAEREGWEGLSDLAQNHDKYAAEAAEEDLQRIHDYYR